MQPCGCAPGGRMRSAAEGEHRTGEDAGEAFTPEPSMTGLCVEQRRTDRQNATAPRTQRRASHDTGNARSQGLRTHAAQRRTSGTAAACEDRPARPARNARAAWRCGGLPASPAGTERQRAPQWASRFSRQRKSARTGLANNTPSQSTCITCVITKAAAGPPLPNAAGQCPAARSGRARTRQAAARLADQCDGTDAGTRASLR